MILSKIIKNAPEIEIKALAFNSKEVQADSIFFAISGHHYDGHDYIEQAIENGAICVVHSKDIVNKLDGIVYIKVKDVIDLMNYIVKIFYKDPSLDLNLIGITGTNGKTTTAKIIQELYNKFEPCAYIGTLGMSYKDKFIANDLTTPDTISLNSFLSLLHQEKIRNCVIEVSSHSLALKRVDNLDFKTAIFTNFSQDHLDFHQTMEDYLIAKIKLFKKLSVGDKAIVNLDDDKAATVIASISDEVQIDTFGFHHKAKYRFTKIETSFEATNISFEYQNQEYHFKSALLSEHNAYNLMAAIIALHQNNYPLKEILKQVAEIKEIEGRMVKIDNNFGINIIIDYAHTPESLKSMYRFAKTVLQDDNKLISVFGSAGYRDQLKRPILGAISDEYCDNIILTEDDPRNEKVTEICEQIKEGIKDTNTLIIEDRYEAIKMALNLANQGDVVLITGKGLEKFMYRDNMKASWMGDDLAVTQALKEMKEKN